MLTIERKASVLRNKRKRGRMNALDDYETLIAHHKAHHQEEAETLARLQKFMDGQETEIARLKVDLARLQNKLDKVKIAFIKYENEANHIYAWKDFTHSLHVILNIPTKE